MKRKEITALTENDFIELLRQNRLFDSFTKGELVCSSCKKPVTMENILSFKKIKNDIIFYCNRLDCKKDK